MDSLGDRMKGYEAAADHALPHRFPIIVRVDGKAFHSYTKQLPRPWCPLLAEAMDGVAQRLCEEIQGAKVAYIQSDEISVLIHNYGTHDTKPWLKNRVQKMASIAAAIASGEMTARSPKVFGEVRPAYFDGRVFVLPEDDVTNYFLWRQQDASRNSLQMLARSLYSHKELHRKAAAQLQEMCWQRGNNWNDLESYWKRGRCVLRIDGDWQIDRNIPIWKDSGRNYIDRFFSKHV